MMSRCNFFINMMKYADLAVAKDNKTRKQQPLKDLLESLTRMSKREPSSPYHGSFSFLVFQFRKLHFLIILSKCSFRIM